MANQIESLLGAEAESLLGHTCQGIPRDRLHLPGPDFVDRVVIQSDRSPVVMRNLQGLFDHGRLGGTGYLSILPVDQGIEHSGGASFAPNPLYFDPENIVRLAIEGGCNAVASTLGVLGSVARRYAHRIPFLVKLNHNELLTQPTLHDQTLFASVQQAYELGMVTFLWAYLRNSGFKKDGVDYHTAADLTGQANHLAATIEADIVKQKQAETNGGFTAIGFGKTHPKVYDELTSDHPVDLVRYQVANCYMGRAGLINSGGASGSDDLAQAVRTAVINKRAGGMGLISGRKAFQKPMEEGVALLHAIQDVYLADAVTIA